jgi:hypothetical protein
MSLQIKGGIKPAFSTWFVWALLTIANCLTYSAVSKHWTESLNVWGAVAMNCSVFLIALVSRNYKPLRLVDYTIIVGGLLGITLYLTCPKGPLPNLIVCACIFLSILPTLDGLKRRNGKENATAWLLIALSYFFFIGVIFVRKEVGWNLVYQLVGIATNGAVWIAARKTSREK